MTEFNSELREQLAEMLDLLATAIDLMGLPGMDAQQRLESGRIAASSCREAASRCREASRASVHMH